MYVNNVFLQTMLSQNLEAADVNYNFKKHFEKLINGKIVELGSGAFGSVYTNPCNENTVIKVSTYRDAYYMYARWCMRPENADNPHVPKVYEEVVFKGPNGQNTYVHVIEKLVPPCRTKTDPDSKYGPDNPSEVQNTLVGLIWAACYRIARHADYEMVNKYKTELDYLREVVKEVKLQAQQDDDITYSPTLRQIMLHKQLIHTFRDISYLFDDTSHLDMHGGNIMIRPGETYSKDFRGDLVITDPVAAFSSTYRALQRQGKYGSSFDRYQYQTTHGFDTQWGAQASVDTELAEKYIASISDPDRKPSVHQYYDFCIED